MLKNKFAIVLLAVVMLCCVVFVSGCGNKNLMEDGEYNAVLIAQPYSFLSWLTDLKVEIKNNELYVEDEKMGKLSEGKVSQDDWRDLLSYHVIEGIELAPLMSVSKCFVIDTKTDLYYAHYANYFYVISNNNNYYLLFATNVEKDIEIFGVYLLE